MKNSKNLLNDFERKSLIHSFKKYNIVNMIYCDGANKFPSYLIFYKIDNFLLCHDVFYATFVDDRDTRVNRFLNDLNEDFHYIFDNIDEHILKTSADLDRDLVSISYSISIMVASNYYNYFDLGLISYEVDKDSFYQELEDEAFVLLKKGLSNRDIIETFFYRFGMLDDKVIEKIVNF